MKTDPTVLDITPLKAENINNNQPKLATHININSKGKVSYFKKSSFRTHWETFNKGTQRWEYAAAVSEDRLYALPVVSSTSLEDEEPTISAVLALGSEEKAEAYARSVESIPADNDSVEAEVVVTNILCNTTPEKTLAVTREIKTPKATLLEPKKEKEEQTVQDKLLDTKTLTKLMQENLHPDFLLRFTPQERNYYIIYDHKNNHWDYSSVVSREMQIVGVTYTNSLRCVERVATYLNENNYSI